MHDRLGSKKPRGIEVRIIPADLTNFEIVPGTGGVYKGSGDSAIL